MKKWLFLVVIVLVFVLVLVGCGVSNNKVSGDKDKFKVVIIFYLMYDFMKNVVGDNVFIEMLIDVGIELYDYELSVKDIVKIEVVDVFVYNSEDMEIWVLSVFKSLDLKKLIVIYVSKGIELVEGIEEEDYDYEYEEGYYYEYDFYVWLSLVFVE